MQRAFNVFSPTIIAYAGETFVWTVNAAELGSSPDIEISSTDPNWPLIMSPATFKVRPGSNSVATVSANGAGTSAAFSCMPSAPNPQTIYVAHRCSGSPCNGATVAPGGHIIWTNDSEEVLIVTPDPKNADYWPLDAPAYAIPPNSWLTLEINEAAALDKTYGIIVTTAGGEQPCDILGQPVIIIQTNGGVDTHPHHKH